MVFVKINITLISIYIYYDFKMMYPCVCLDKTASLVCAWMYISTRMFVDWENVY